MYMLKEELRGDTCGREELLELISDDQFDRYRNARYLEKDSPLLRHALVETIENRMFIMQGREFHLASDVAPRILRAAPKTDAERIAEIIRSTDLLSLSSSRVDLGQLILPASVKEMLETAVTQCRDDVGRTLHQWGWDGGVFRSSPEDSRKYRPAMLLLFYGPPGTGKTFAAGAIAKSLGKDLLVTDVSRILSAWVGESEGNVRKLFAQYEQIVRRAENPPVLLLNECDQFLTARGKTDRSVDRRYNQMQNLFLEAFERLEGVLIATTNLRDNLDPAFSRRFHLKLEFPVPDAASRRKLWDLHLLPTLPCDPALDRDRLAERFTLTGGQIAVVVKNAAVEAAQQATRRRRITQALLEKYAQLEQGTAFGASSGARIGF
jgi:Cdc6-like AAA superfamily ATPase